MIGTIDIEVNAGHPDLALDQVCGFVDSPSSVRIANVPNKIGEWRITAVKVVITSPDNQVQTVNCVHTNDVWVGTIEAPLRTGKTVGGFQVIADGVDENGTAVTGYVLGVGDYMVLNRDNTEGETKYALHLHDETPEQPVKADVVRISADWKMYDGTSWIPFGGDNDYDKLHNKPSINGVMLSGDKTPSELGLAKQAELSGYLPLGEGGTIQGIPLQISQFNQMLRISDGGAGHYAGTVTIWPDGIEIYGPDGLVADCVQVGDLNQYKTAEGTTVAQAIGNKADKSQLSAYALSSVVARDYTTLALFNETLGNLESIINGI